jgi:sugar lactone lactonase YvrE
MHEIACVAHTADILGETPLWHPAERVLYWIDLFKPAIHCLDTATGTLRSWTPPEKLGSFALREGGGFLLAGRSGLSIYDATNDTMSRLANPEADDRVNLLNDGRCDRMGRFWVGSMNRLQQHPSGRLHCLEGCELRTVADGLWLPNSLCWSPDATRMYLADSRPRTIYVCEFDLERGVVGERRTFATLPDGPGVPDGSSVDCEGFLWNTVFDGGCVVRYAPDGRVDRVIRLPVTRPTACTFGGDDLAILYVTTARFRLTDGQLAEEPAAGGVLALDVGVRGLPEPLFVG